MDFPPQKVTVFKNCTEKNLVNGQIIIWWSRNPENCHEPLWIISLHCSHQKTIERKNRLDCSFEIDDDTATHTHTHAHTCTHTIPTRKHTYQSRVRDSQNQGWAPYSNIPAHPYMHRQTHIYTHTHTFTRRELKW